MLQLATRKRNAWPRRRKSLISRRSVKSRRSVLIAGAIHCFISCRLRSLQFDQDGIALIPQPLFDEELCFLKLLGQLLGAEVMDECTFKAIAGFILPIEGGPPSQPHEQPFRRSGRNPGVAPCGDERNDEDTAGFQNRMRLPQETNPTPPRKDI